MALHCAKVTQAGNDTHADCLRIITRAEIIMADEIDRGQASGHHHGKVQTSDLKPATYDELGIDKRRVSEWRYHRACGRAGTDEGGHPQARARHVRDGRQRMVHADRYELKAD